MASKEIQNLEDLHYTELSEAEVDFFQFKPALYPDLIRTTDIA